MNRFFLSLPLFMCLATFTSATERSQIEADSMVWLEARGITTFSGSVRYQYPAKKITILADKLEIRRQANQLISVIAEGKPVNFQQLAEADNLIKGHANHIYYDAQAETVKLSGSAELLSGSNILRGEVLLYDVRNQTAEVSGDGQDDGRFEAIIQPTTKQNDKP